MFEQLFRSVSRRHVARLSAVAWALLLTSYRGVVDVSAVQRQVTARLLRKPRLSFDAELDYKPGCRVSIRIKGGTFE